MGGSNGLTPSRNHLIEGTALPELGIQLLTEFTGAAGTRRVEAMDDGWVNMIHEKKLLILVRGNTVVCRSMRPSHD
jgi:hypothetical protein